MNTGRHQCLIYNGSPTEHLVLLVPVLKQMLNEKYRCMIMGSPAVVTRMKIELSVFGVNVADKIREGAFILTSDQTHLVNGLFDVDRMIDKLETLVEDALEEGYKGFWASGDMTWEFGTEKNFPKLVEYERRLEELFQRTPELIGVCQYHQDMLPLHILNDGLATHPTVFINRTLQKLNPYYLPSDSAERDTPNAETIEQRLVQMMSAEFRSA